MSTALDAPRTGEAAAFATAADCKAWLKGVSLINAAEAHARLLATLIELNAVPIDAAERLEILETLRQSVVFVQSELAKRFVARALPLSPEEREAFAAAMALWDALAAGYDLCLEESVRTAAFPRTSLALAQRARSTPSRAGCSITTAPGCGSPRPVIRH